MYRYSSVTVSVLPGETYPRLNVFDNGEDIDDIVLREDGFIPTLKVVFPEKDLNSHSLAERTQD